MAGRENTVDLVVKARNEASKNLDIITEAWKDLKSEMESAGSATGKANTSLGQLGSALGTLMREAKGLTALSTIAENMDQAAGAVKRLQSSVRDGAGDFAKLAREAEASEKAVNRLKGQIAAEEGANKAAAVARKTANAELTAANRALKEAERNQERYNNSVAKAARATKGVGVDIGTPQTSARASAGAFIAAELERNRAAQAQAANTVKQYTDEVTRSSQALKELAPQLKSASDLNRRLTNETTKQNSALQQNRSALVQARDEQAKIKTVADQASAAMGGLAVKQGEVAAAAAKNAAELDRTARAIQALNKFSSGGAEVVDPKQAAALQKQVTAVNELREDWKALESEAKRLASGLQSVSGNATQQVDAFKRITEAARRAKTEYTAQIEALDKLRVAAGLPVSGLARAAQAANTGAQANRNFASSASSALPPIRSLGQGAQSAGSAMNQSADGADKLNNALSKTSRGGRDALSLFQRIRGEILSLTASYIGLNAAIGQIGAVIKAFQTLEAAQSRLGVVFNQDTGKVSSELQFLERNAARLGIEFGTLSDQYSKFAVAASSANFSAQNTRDIFLSVAEAGRVNKLSIDQLNGVFLALEQMISKGKVSSEELRRQLGDRLAGAFNIFASAIGKSAAELDEMMRKGEVLSDETTMLKFADELRRRFGPQLGSALATTTTELGKFQNNLFQAQLAVGKGGFIDAFTDGLRTMNQYFQSQEGREFFLSLGAALGKLTQGLVALMPYMDDFARVVGVIVALKVAKGLSGWIDGMKASALETGKLNREMFTWQGTVIASQAKWNAFAGSLRTGTGVLAGLNSQLKVSTVVAGTAGTRFLAMQAALSSLARVAGVAAGGFRLLWSAIGGLPGIILTGVTLAVTSWMTEVDNTTAALDRHKAILETVLTKYDEIKGKVSDTKLALEGMSKTQIDKNVLDLRDAVKTVKDEIAGMRPGGMFYVAPANQRGVLAEITKLKDAYEAGEVSAEKFKKALQNLYPQISDDEIRKYVASLEETATKGADLEQALGQAAVMAKEAGSSLNGLDKDSQGVGKSLSDLADASEKSGKSLEAVAKENADKFNKSMEEMGKLIPSVAEELKKLETIKGLEEQFKQAIKFAGGMDDVAKAFYRYQQGMSATEFGNLGSDGGSAAFNLIRKFEGYKATPYWDVNAYRAGYGSDTVTLADGSIQKVVQGMTVSITDANRDLTRRIEEFAGVARSQIGANRFDSFAPQQQAVLTSIAYNYGDLKSTGILKTLQEGTVQEIADAIRSLSTHNDGVNSKRRNQEAHLFSGGGDFTEKQFEVERKRLETQKEYNEGLKERISLQENENSNAGRLTQEGFIQKKLNEEIAKAKKAGVTLDDEMIAKLKAMYAEEYKITQEKRDQKTEIQEANLALQNAQALETQRNALMAQYKQAMREGDVENQAGLQSQLVDLNAQIVAAAENARQMWEAIGGPEAAAKLPIIDALIAKTQTAGTSIANVGRQVNSLGMTSQQTQQLVGSFVDGLVGVFDTFAQAVANGENAFQALGQAFLQFAANFLKEIAMMIMKQMLLNALAGFGGPIGKAASALGGAVAHGGGTIGSTNRSRRVDASTWSAAAYYHVGGVAGLKSNEVPAILERGEVIRTQAQEGALQDRLNSADAAARQSGNAAVNLKVANVFNPIDVLEQSLATVEGERVFLNFMTKNASKVNGAING